MNHAIVMFLAAANLSASATGPTGWNERIDEILGASKSVKEPTSTAVPPLAQRFQTLFRRHRLSHIQRFEEKNGRRSLSADIYYGVGELHVVQHKEGSNLVTKGPDIYEWNFSARTGYVSPVVQEDLVDYLIYLTDPAMFPLHLYKLYHEKPELFDESEPDESGYVELRLKEEYHGLRALSIDPKSLWFYAIEWEDEKKGEVTKIIFSKPKAIKQIPEAVFEPLERVKFRKAKHSVRRHMHYL